VGPGELSPSSPDRAAVSGTIAGAARTTERRVTVGTSLAYGLLFLDRLAPLYLVVILRDSLAPTDASLALPEFRSS
jgi:hypothetical protein